MTITQTTAPPTRELANVLQTTLVGRQSAFALRQGTAYVPARTNGEDDALSLSAIENHLSGVQPIGIYLLESGSDKCRFGLFDIDDHDGLAGWDRVRLVAEQIATALKRVGLRFVSFRSGGGHGIHIAVPFSQSVNAARLRKAMKQILAGAGFKDGAGGVSKNEVEVFPKQDLVKPGSYGSLVALPLARASVLLDETFEPTKSSPLQVLTAFVSNEAKFLDGASQVAGTKKPVAVAPATADNSTEHPLSKCLFIQHCESNAPTLSEPLWYAAACNLAPTANGEQFFDELSALDAGRYDALATASKFEHAAKSEAPHTCAKIAELGFICPNMKTDGHCAVHGGRHPVSFAKTVKQLVADLRLKKPIPDRNRRIAALVIDRLKLDGTFYVANDDESMHYFYTAEKRLYPIAGRDFRALCCELFGLNSAEQEYKFVLADIETYCNRSGIKVDFFRFSRYTNRVLYINAGANRVFRLDGKSILTVDNGTDGILFRDSGEVEPVEPANEYSGSPVRTYLVNALNTKDSALQDLYSIYIYALFFESLLPTKPIVLVTGEKGSGKSFAGRVLKRALFGGNSDVDTGLTADEKNAVAAFANNYFLCMDNVDGKVDWMANLLASVSTGTQIKARKLYENNVEIAFTPRVFVMINSRNPISLKRDDVVDRLLIFKVDRYEQFLPEAKLLNQISDNRGAIWRELLTNLNRIVKRLKNGIPTMSTEQRMADFANLGLLIAKVIGAKETPAAFAQLEAERNSMVLENHPLLAGLKLYINTHPKSEWIATGALFAEIKRLDIHYPVKSPQTFGQQLKDLGTNLRSYIDIEFRNASQNMREVRLAKLGQLSQPPVKVKAKKPKRLLKLVRPFPK